MLALLPQNFREPQLSHNLASVLATEPDAVSNGSSDKAQNCDDDEPSHGRILKVQPGRSRRIFSSARAI